MKVSTRNYWTYYLQTAAYNIALMLSSGAVMQTFMLECGIGEERVSLYVSVLQIVQTAVMLLVSKATENIRNIRLAVAVSFIAYIPFFSVMMYLCGERGIAVDTKYIIIFAVSLLLNIFVGLYSIVSYKLPHIIMDMRDYGTVLGQSGVIAGILSMLFSSAMTVTLKKGEYMSVMRLFFAIGIVIGIIAIVASFLFKQISHGADTTDKTKINFFKYKPFYRLIIPNFMRGFSLGIFNLITVIGYSCGLLDSSSAAIIATVTQISMLVSCQTYSLLVRKVRNGIIVLSASIVFCVTAPMMTATSSKLWFYVFYFIAYFFVNYVAYSVPVIVANHIDYNVLSQYTAWRMALFTLGIAAGGALVPILLNLIGHTGTLIVCGLTILPCGIGYYLFEHSQRIKKGCLE
ncbi:MAG: hypothetical protein IJB86_09445 [Clostridia bacterium]|nr:hypothetical protein [Clostridia bacterium]